MNLPEIVEKNQLALAYLLDGWCQTWLFKDIERKKKMQSGNLDIKKIENIRVYTCSSKW